MKKAYCACWLLLSVMVLYAKGIQEEIHLADAKTRLSYALGMVMGEDFEPAALLDLDYAAFAEGLKTSVEKGEAKISQDEAYELVQNALQAAMVKRAEENQVKEAQFLSQNGARPEVQTTASGLQYEALAEAEGAKPGRADTARVHYEGSLSDGTVFDSSWEREEYEDLPLNRIIPGLAEGLQLMSAGSKYRFYIPSRLAYGETGAGPLIPPYATVIFTVELLEIIPQTPEAADPSD
jgi:FKBP-type peptidyl-prolyl cis-trans isomerase